MTEENTVVDNKEVTQGQNQEVPTITESEKPAETQEQINWKRFREQREIERKQKDAAEKLAAQKTAEAEAIKAAMEAILNKPSPASPQYQEQEDESEDMRIQKKVEAALAVRYQKEEEQRRQKEHAEYPQKLVQTFSDFNDVCSADNLDYLEYHYPEVAAPFAHLPDGYAKWAAVYKAVKRFVPNTANKKDSKLAEKNFTKPQSMSVGGVTQTGDSAPQQLDEKRRADNWARMQRVMKGGR